MKTLKMFGVLALLIMAGALVAPALAWQSRTTHTSTLSAEDVYWLTYMREEEKLARDVYLKLYDEWGMTIFKNIAASEQNHMDAIKTLLDRYCVPDPVSGMGVGELTDKFSTLYDELLAQGKISRVEALNVGVTIEEMDISDLEDGIAATTHRDIKNVYSNLLQGSLNHLAAFESLLAKYS